MARRVIAIPLAVAIAIAVFSVSVFGTSLPPNNISLNYDVIFSESAVGKSFSLSDVYNLSTGDFFFFAECCFNNGVPTRSDGYHYSINVTLSTTYDLYICVRTASLDNNNINFGNLSPYYDSVSNISYLYPTSPYDLVGLNVQTGKSYIVDDNFASSDVRVTFLSFKDVPANTLFTLTDNLFSYDGQSYGPVVGSNKYYTWRTIGVYVTLQSYTSSQIVDDYISGNLSFENALNDVNDAINNAISNADSLDQALFELIKGQYELDRLISNSDNISVQNVKQHIEPGFNQTINDYVSGNTSLDDALFDMSQQYTAALNSAETPEQGIFINTTYQIKMKQFELEARRQAAAKVDSAISDDQLSEADEYYQSEEELISIFKVAEFESALDFELWFNTLPPAESTEYKKFFDYILNDSSIRMFLIVPISLVLVRIIFGTVLHLRVRHD